jgi:predicted short-subunit dehydrogenase-like oxidoreductase (DUF2520 family)
MGNVGTHLVARFIEVGLAPVWVGSHSPVSCETITARFGIPCFGHLSPPIDLDVLLLTVRDDALAECALALRRQLNPNCIVCHTAGSVPLSALMATGTQIGVFYPMQTFSKGRTVDFDTVPFFLEGNEAVLAVLRPLAQRISKDVRYLDSNGRKALHIGAVFAANFVNYMLTCADQLLAPYSDANYQVYLKLLNEVVAKLHEMPPRAAQTGPAFRGDLQVVQDHTHFLEEKAPELACIYRLLSEHISQTKT